MSHEIPFLMHAQKTLANEQEMLRKRVDHVERETEQIRALAQKALSEAVHLQVDVLKGINSLKKLAYVVPAVVVVTLWIFERMR